MGMLLGVVEKSLSELSSKYRLQIREGGDRSVLLTGCGFAIDIRLERDGLLYLYYDLEFDVIKVYNIGLFLFSKRRGLLRFEKEDKSSGTMKEYLEFNLTVFARHMQDAGQDILRGEKDWIKLYTWPARSLPANQADRVSKQKL